MSGLGVIAVVLAALVAVSVLAVVWGCSRAAGRLAQIEREEKGCGVRTTRAVSRSVGQGRGRTPPPVSPVRDPQRLAQLDRRLLFYRDHHHWCSARGDSDGAAWSVRRIDELLEERSCVTSLPPPALPRRVVAQRAPSRT